ncbi:MAG: AI-2E family transporter [Fibromonadaceae bacterium]|jgi:predicted PurR-regulated permease PerM|nr:AI-2E family transporter [Fibromonadaceae bacterium]
MHENSEIYWNTDRKMRLLFAVSGFSVFFLLLYHLADVLTPFVIAFLLAYILNPLVNLLQKKVKHRWLASLLVLLALAVVLIGAALTLAPMIVEQIVQLGRLLQKYASDGTWRETLIEYLPKGVWEKIQHVWEDIWEEKNFMPVWLALQNFDLMTIVQNILGKIVPGAVGVFSGVGKMLAWFFGVFMITLCLVFMLLDFEKMKATLSAQIPQKHSKEILNFFRSFDSIMGKYFRAQTSVAATVGVLFSISFSIMKLPMGLPFGLLIGALNMVPYLQVVSIPVAIFLGLIYSLETGMAFWQVVLIITAIYAGIQILQDSVIVPKIMGGTLGLSPILILLSLAVWGKLLGFLGLVLAIPFTCVIIATYKSVRERK